MARNPSYHCLAAGCASCSSASSQAFVDLRRYAWSPAIFASRFRVAHRGHRTAPVQESEAVAREFGVDLRRAKVLVRFQVRNLTSALVAASLFVRQTGVRLLSSQLRSSAIQAFARSCPTDKIVLMPRFGLPNRRLRVSQANLLCKTCNFSRGFDDAVQTGPSSSSIL